MVLALSIVSAALLLTAAPGRAALLKPTYTAGDRWTYLLSGSLGGLPGFEGNASPSIRLSLNGLAEVDVVGPTQTLVGGTSVAAVAVDTHATGSLSGTFAIPGNASIGITGTFASNATEAWEDRAYLPVASDSSTTFAISVSLLPTSVQATVWANATTAYAAVPPFNLSVGGSAATPFTTDLMATTSVSFFGPPQRIENRTTVSGTWSRQVLAQETVSVEAGTFVAYRLNGSLGGFPGFAGVLPMTGANETAWWSNEVGNFVKRVAYVNGTSVAEMRLKSYTYPAASGGLSLLEVTLLAAVPVAVAAVVLLWVILRRGKRREPAATRQEPVGPVGELPPKDSGGRP